jgi:general secretion pathway protein D
VSAGWTNSLPGRGRALATAALAVLLLAGCAAQSEFRSGNELIQQGKVPEGLAKLEEAARLEPGSAEYRIAVIQGRDRYVQALLAQADRAQTQGALDVAEHTYRSVLAFQGGQERALAGLRQIDGRRRANRALAAAQSAMGRKDWEVARTELHSVLLDNPQQPDAMRLLRRIEEVTAEPNPASALSSAYRKPISIEFKDASLKTVFEMIARSSGLNFLFDKDVKTDQKTSIFLRDSTTEAAVNLTLMTNQLEQRVLDANTVLIYPNTPAKLNEYQPLTIKSFYLANADAKSLAATLKTLLKVRDVVVDEKLNLLIVRDSPEAIKLAEKVVALHDLPDAEVMLEVEILEVKRTRLLDLGVAWPDQVSFAPLAATSGGSLTVSDLRHLNANTLGASVGPMTINAKKTDSDANILANPRIRVRNREKAKILIGDRVPNITTTSTSTGFVSESINYVDVGLKLDVEPSISLDNEVAIKIALEVSSITNQIQTKGGSLAYQIGTRTASTVLRLKDGENQVLAGLINDEERHSSIKVPGLGEIPVVGRLFGSQTDDGTKSEIVLSITPHILRNLQRPDASDMEFESGTEMSLRTHLSGMTGKASSDATSLSIGAGRTPGTASVPAPSPRDALPADSVNDVNGSTAPGALQSGARMSWQGPVQVHVGDEFVTQLMMQSDQGVASAPATVLYDPAILQLVAVSEGDFLSRGGAPTTFSSRVGPPGQASVSATRTGVNAGATSLGPVASFRFRVLKLPAGPASLRVSSAAPTGSAGEPVTVVLPAPYLILVKP